MTRIEIENKYIGRLNLGRIKLGDRVYKKGQLIVTGIHFENDDYVIDLKDSNPYTAVTFADGQYYPIKSYKYASIKSLIRDISKLFNVTSIRLNGSKPNEL